MLPLNDEPYLEIALGAAARRLGVPRGVLTARALSRGVTHETLLVLRESEPVAVFRLAPPRLEILPRHTPSEEGVLLQRLGKTPLPVPEVLISDPDGRELGRPGLLLSYAPGESTLTWESLRARCGPGIAEHTLDLLCQMHAVPTDGWPDAAAADSHAQRDLDGARALAARAGASAPAELMSALASLELAAPAPSGPACIVHGDYRPANLMARDGQITGILDWEMTTTGDPACDLGIASMQPWGTWWEDEELLSRYAAGSATEVPVVALLWWRCLGYAKVVAFLAARVRDGWGGGPGLRKWVDGMADERSAWQLALRG
ncbi:MAG: phosphotransferase family protein [Solirubrobacteraceae bacterium]